MSRLIAAMVLVGVTAACEGGPRPTPPGEPSTSVISGELHAWAQGARDMVWRHVRQGPPPNLPAKRIDTCRNYAIVFFDSGDGDLLWAAGRLAESPEGADGGFVASADAETLAADRRSGQVDCRVLFDAIP